MKRILCAAALIASLPSVAAAIPVTWDVSGSLFSGRTVFDPFLGFTTFVPSGVADLNVAGSFTFDADTGVFSDVSITVGDEGPMITPLSGFFAYNEQGAGATFGFGNGADITGIGVGSDRVVYFGTDAPLTNAGGAITATSSFSFPGVALLGLGSLTLTGTPVSNITPVPLPAGGGLLLAGLFGLAALRRKV